MGKWKSRSEGEVVQIKFLKPTEAKSHSESGRVEAWKLGESTADEKAAWPKETDKEQVTVRNRKQVCWVGTQSQR